MKSRAIINIKNKKKNNSSRKVNRINCQTSRITRNTTRKIAHRGIDIERNSIPPVKSNILIHLNIWNDSNLCHVEIIKKSYDVRFPDRNDDILSNTKCFNLLKNGRVECSIK